MNQDAKTKGRKGRCMTEDMLLDAAINVIKMNRDVCSGSCRFAVMLIVDRCQKEGQLASDIGVSADCCPYGRELEMLAWFDGWEKQSTKRVLKGIKV